MNTTLIYDFLKAIAVNNNRQWFQEHKNEYQTARQEFETEATQLIRQIASFDPTVAHLSVKDCVYRFNRDTRFSPDKSPYKRHFCVYISAHGKKSLHGGYYVHVEPGQCILAVGTYWLPTNILTACRNEIMANEEEWLRCVENPDFLHIFGSPDSATWEDAQGFGMTHLKTCPVGFPRDYAYLRYLRQKDYCCWRRVDDDFFAQPDWMQRAIEIFKVAKPMMDFINSVVDDYE